jgi:hypothetical protein
MDQGRCDSRRLMGAEIKFSRIEEGNTKEKREFKDKHLGRRIKK